MTDECSVLYPPFLSFFSVIYSTDKEGVLYYLFYSFISISHHIRKEKKNLQSDPLRSAPVFSEVRIVSIGFSQGERGRKRNHVHMYMQHINIRPYIFLTKAKKKITRQKISEESAHPIHIPARARPLPTTVTTHPHTLEVHNPQWIQLPTPSVICLRRIIGSRARA